jgi:hypothetical protein
MTHAAELLTARTADDQGNDIPRFTNFRVVVPLSENRRVLLSSGGEVSVRIEAHDAEIDAADKNSYLWEGLVPHRHVSDYADYILETAADELARQGFRVDAAGWVTDGENWTAGIEAQPPLRRCHCNRLAHRVFTPLDPATDEPNEAATFYRCSLHIWDFERDCMRERQICWRGVDFGPEPYCLELIEYDEDERGFGGWKHVHRLTSFARHHAVPRF